jgi:hypothetical protein
MNRFSFAVAMLGSAFALSGTMAVAQTPSTPLTAHIAPMPDRLDRSHRVRLAESPPERCPEAIRAGVRAEQSFIDGYADQVDRAIKRHDNVAPATDAKLGLELQAVVSDDAYAVIVRRPSNDVPRSRISDLISCSGLTGGTAKQARALGLYAPASGAGAGALLYSPYIGLYVLSI